MEDSTLKFQCIMCFSIGKINKSELGHQHTCSNCGKVVQLPNSSFASGRVIANDFVIKRKLGSGGMGSVFLAHQLSMDREVALKVLFYKYTKDERYYLEFNEEAKAAARVSHINVVQSLAFGSDQGLLYLAMNYVDGETFDKIIKKRKKLEIDDALNIIQQIAEGLHAAWTERQLIHRDIKPANIIITEDGVVKISDFGLARRAHEVNVQTISGSPAYMSPEQFAQRPLDCRSDIYSLGITLFEALTGRLPFTGSNASAVAYRHINEAIPVGKIKPALPRNIRGLIRKMTAKNPNERFSNPEDLLNRVVEIRKKMAVDKALVAGVHTVSIKRQNFLEPKRVNDLKTIAQYNQDRGEDSPTKTINKTLVITYLTIVLLIMLGLYTMVANRNFRTKMDSQFARLKADITTSQKSLLEKLDSNVTKLGEKMAQTQLELSFSNIQKERKLQDSFLQINKKISDVALVGKIEHDEKSADVALLETRLTNLHRLYKNSLWLFLLQHNSRSGVERSLALLEFEKEHGSVELRPWLDERIKELTYANFVYGVIERNAIHFAQKEISLGKIILVSEKSKYFVTEKDGKKAKVYWHDLPMKDIKALTAEYVTNLDVDRQYRFYALYTLKLSYFMKAGKKNKVYISVLDSFYNYNLDLLKLTSSKSKEKLQENLLRWFAGTKWESELKARFNNN